MSIAITLEGNVGTTPEQRETKAQVPVANFRLAVKHRVQDASGQWSDNGDPSWFTVAVYGALAVQVVKQVSKGDAIVLNGTLRIREWTNAVSGARGTTAEVVASSVGHNLRLVRSEQAPVVVEPAH